MFSIFILYLQSQNTVKMKKYLLFLLGLFATALPAMAQQTEEITQEKARLPHPYNVEEDGDAKITELLKKAKKEHKKLLVQIGGNWCVWCLRFNNLVTTDPQLKAILDKKYIYYHLNYSPENKNPKAFAKYGNPGEKFGYPAFLIIDSKGTVLYTQKSEELEEGRGYSTAKVKKFLQGRL